MPEKIRSAIWSFTKIYKDAGYECYLVGGSCRDLLLDEMPYDYDFATNCPLAVSRRMFKKLISVGESHGTLIIFYRGFQFELTRYRRDVKTDGRRAVIEYSESIEEDQKRRDLRINALAYDVVTNQLVDSQNGLLDFKEKKIRFVGRVEERIKEDHLRALRYARLIARLSPSGFNYDRDDLAAVIRVFDSRSLSVERIYDELEKILSYADQAEGFLMEYLPELKIFRRFFDDNDHADQAIRKIINTRSLLPLPYLYMKSRSLNEAAEELRLSRSSKRVLSIIDQAYGKNLDDPLVIKEILAEASNIDTNILVKAVQDLLDKDITPGVDQILREQSPYRIKDLKINGEDLINLGVSGRAIGDTLKYLQKKIWEHPELNDEESLLGLVREKLDAK